MASLTREKGESDPLFSNSNQLFRERNLTGMVSLTREKGESDPLFSNSNQLFRERNLAPVIAVSLGWQIETTVVYHQKGQFSSKLVSEVTCPKRMAGA